MSVFADSFELLKNQCIQIVTEMTNEHDGITEYPDYHSHEFSLVISVTIWIHWFFNSSKESANTDMRESNVAYI